MALRRTALVALGAACSSVFAAAPGAPAASTAPAGVCAGLGGCRVVARADVDGDGSPDAIGLARRDGGLGKRGVVVVRVATAPRHLVSTRLPLENWSGTPWQGVATLDGRRGKDIMVGRQMGASAQFYQSVTWRHGSLVPLDAPGPDRWWGVGQSATVVGGWVRRVGDPPGVIRARIATSTSPGLFRGRVTTYRWTPQGWHRVGSRTVSPLSVQRVRGWGGFHVPGLARW